MKKVSTMKRISLIFLLLAMMFGPIGLLAKDSMVKSYLKSFDYQARRDMKIKSPELVRGLTKGKIQLVDIRFREEHEAWRTGMGRNIPLNELPGRLNELSREKIIVTACPHKDRAIIAMVFLRSKGFTVKYLADGLIGLAEYLRGDRAKNFVRTMAQ